MHWRLLHLTECQITLLGAAHPPVSLFLTHEYWEASSVCRVWLLEDSNNDHCLCWFYWDDLFFFFLQKCWDELSFVQLPEVKKYILIITVGVYITIIVFVLKQLIYWVSIEIHRCLFLRNTKCLEIISNCQININFENAHTETNKNKKKQQSQLQVLRKHCFELMVYSVKVMNVWFSFSIQLGEFLVVYTLRWKLPSRERALDTADASLEVIAAKGSTKKHF